MTPSTDFAALLAAAQAGDRSAVGRLLEAYRPYLLAVANADLSQDLRAKAGGSDMVQQSFTEAQAGIRGFDGSTEDEFRAWLRRILQNNLVDFHREYFATGARDVRRERPSTDSRPLDQYPANEPTPSGQAAAVEEELRLERALTQLPEDYRRVIELRNRDCLRFAEIAVRMGRTEDAARMLWNRAVDALQRELNAR